MSGSFMHHNHAEQLATNLNIVKKANCLSQYLRVIIFAIGKVSRSSKYQLAEMFLSLTKDTTSARGKQMNIHSTA